MFQASLSAIVHEGLPAGRERVQEDKELEVKNVERVVMNESKIH